MIKNININLNHIDIREVLDELGIDYKESGKNIGKDWIGICCPFCGDDLNYHLGVCLTSPVISCFRCGKMGNLITLISKELGSFNKAIRILKKFIPLELKAYDKKEDYNIKTNVEFPKGTNRTPSIWQKRYLRNRGYSWKKLHDKYNLHYCGPIGDFANRIIVPIYRRRKMVTFTSIDIVLNSKLRYKHLPDDKSIIPIKQLLFGIENTNRFSVCIVEGIFDQFRIGNGSVCTFGTKLTPEQILLLSKFQIVYIAFDGDKPGKEAAIKIRDNLMIFSNVKIIHLPNSKDPDSLDPKDIKQIRNLLN